MSTGGQQLGSWHEQSYVAQWADDDVVADMLDLPRKISAALVADDGVDVEHVIDLGSGHGPYLALFLRTFPGARGTWVDSSEPMLDLARERLAEFGDRIRVRGRRRRATRGRGDRAGAGDRQLARAPPLLARGADGDLPRLLRPDGARRLPLQPRPRRGPGRVGRAAARDPQAVRRQAPQRARAAPRPRPARLDGGASGADRRGRVRDAGRRLADVLHGAARGAARGGD